MYLTNVPPYRVTSLSDGSSPPVPLSEKSSPPCPPLREVLTPLSPSPRSPHPPVPLSLRERGDSQRPPPPRRGDYPPAIAPTTRKGSVPDATASGSGASGGSWVRSRSHAKNRRNGRPSAVTWSRILPRSMG